VGGRAVWRLRGRRQGWWLLVGYDEDGEFGVEVC